MRVQISIKIIMEFTPFFSIYQYSQVQEVPTNNAKTEYRLSETPAQRRNSRSLSGKGQSPSLPQCRRRPQVSPSSRSAGCALFKKTGVLPTRLSTAWTQWKSRSCAVHLRGSVGSSCYRWPERHTSLQRQGLVLGVSLSSHRRMLHSSPWAI